MRAFIYASGRGERFGEQDRHKQLLEADGVPIIVRTLHQLLERGCEVYVVTPHQPIINAVGDANIMDVGSPALFAETYEKTAPYWAPGLNLAVLGDVFYSEDAMDAMVRAEEMTFFGRPFPSVVTRNSAAGEIFAWTWVMPDDERTVRTAINLTIEDAQSKEGAHRDILGTPLGCPWQIYRACVGEPLVQPCILSRKRWVTINDFTDDFDFPDSHANWLAQYKRRIVRQPKLDDLLVKHA